MEFFFFLKGQKNCIQLGPGTGFNGRNGLDPETIINPLKTYVIPILNYGMEIIIPMENNWKLYTFISKS